MADSRSPEEIEADIARQREQLARTVDQLEAKFDVRARVGTRQVAAAGGALAALLVLVWWWRRR